MIRQQRGDCQCALFFEIRVGFVEGIIVEVILVVTDLAEQPVLIDIRRDDLFKRARAESIIQREAHHFDMVGTKHRSIIPVGTRHFGYNDCMSFYTSKGDDGTTNLLGEGRVAKYHARIEAVGTLDESSAALGLARAQCLDPRSSGILLEAQRDLYRLMAEVAATPENAERFHSIDAARVTWLERQTDELSKLIEMPKEFILPGDSVAGAALSLARAIIRRAERRVVELFDAEELKNPDLQRYLNRLSSLCFVLELLENRAAGHNTTLAKE